MYDYRENVKQDVLEYIEENAGYLKVSNKDELEEELYDSLWTTDSVTGNASGSYTFNTYKAEENLNGNWGLLQEALEDFGCDELNPIEMGAEWCDVTIRCYLLCPCIAEVIEELDKEVLDKIFEQNKDE